MTATISYDDPTYFPHDENDNPLTESNTVREILEAFANNGLEGSHPVNTGGFQGGGAFDGTSYSYGDESLGFAFEATGDLHYYFGGVSGPVVPGATNHTLYGEIDSITLGAGINTDGTVSTPFITFNFDDPLEGTLAEGRTNVVHDVIWGLMNGSVDGATDSIGTISQGGLVAALDNNGLDVDQSIASLVGSSSATHSELLLAA